MGNVHLLGGGTLDHVRPHLALSAPAYGTTARALATIIAERGAFAGHDVVTTLTRMADHTSRVETNDDVAALLDALVLDRDTKVVFQSMALCDWRATVAGDDRRGRGAPRLRSDAGDVALSLSPAEKLIGRVRARRKDIFLVGFKTTAGATRDEQFERGLSLLKLSSANLVFCNDVHTRRMFVVTPEQARYHDTTDRRAALEALVEMADLRSRGTFTRSTVVAGEPVAWGSPLVSRALRVVVEHCVERGAYKPFLGATVGHFAARLPDGTFLTSRRKTNFNRIGEVGLVRVEARGDHEVIAHGSKPSVGGQSQRIVFAEHAAARLDTIVHFHCPLRDGARARVPVREQRPFECGSHECGRNTSSGLAEVAPGIWAVMLDRHGPNVVFRSDVDPERVIAFIEESFDLSRSTSEA